MRIPLMTWAVLISALVFDLCGQEIPKARAVPDAGEFAAARMRESTNRGPTIPELVFQGGTIVQLIDELKHAGKAAGLAPLNVILPGTIPEEPIPLLELHNVRYADVFQALNRMRTFGVWETTGNGQSAADIWVLASPPMVMPQQIDPLTGQIIGPDGPPKTCQIYQLRRYLDTFNVEDITTAIQTAWSMMNLKGADLKYHKDTSLLIAVGDSRQLDVISRVLRSLDEGLALNNAGARTAANTKEVIVLGSVNKPGPIPLPQGEELDVLGAIARAGGLNTRGSENGIRLSRPGEADKTFSWEALKKSSPPVKAGDTIEVREKLF